MSGIIINIKRRPRRSGMNAGDQNGGIIRGPRRKRMLPKKRKVGGINFYDLGQIRVGENWVDLPFSRSSWDDEFQPIPLDITDFNNLRSLIFDVDISDWRSMYRKFSYTMAERFGVDFFFDGGQFGIGRTGSRWKLSTNDLITENHWTERGFSVDALPAEWELLSNGGFIRLGTTADYKITNSLDYEAAAVPFELQSGADIFLIPAIGGFAAGGANLIDGIHYYMDTDRILETWAVGIMSTILSRELFLTRNDSQAATLGYPNNDLMTFATGNAVYNDSINQAAMHANLLSTGEVGWHTVYDPPPGLPGPGVTTPMAPSDVLDVSYVQGGNLYYKTIFPESLAGVIMQPSGTYYIWRVSESVGGSNDFGPAIKIR